MPEIIKSYCQTVPAMKLIGKKYSNSDRVNGSFGALWGEWFEKGWFDLIEKQVPSGIAQLYEDGNAYIGFMRSGAQGFEYWIGCFTPVDTATPEGFDSIDFPSAKMGVCWVYGHEEEIYMQEENCIKQLKADGYEIIPDWGMERYVCPRFTTPDESGKIILDICFHVN